MVAQERSLGHAAFEVGAQLDRERDLLGGRHPAASASG